MRRLGDEVPWDELPPRGDLLRIVLLVGAGIVGFVLLSRLGLSLYLTLLLDVAYGAALQSWARRKWKDRWPYNRSDYWAKSKRNDLIFYAVTGVIIAYLLIRSMGS